MNLKIPENDWMIQHLNDPDTLLAEFNLCWGFFVQIRLENILRVHIQSFKEAQMLEKYPSKQGVVINIPT